MAGAPRVQKPAHYITGLRDGNANPRDSSPQQHQQLEREDQLAGRRNRVDDYRHAELLRSRRETLDRLRLRDSSDPWELYVAETLGRDARYHRPYHSGPWQFSALALVGMVVMLSAIFLHLVSDASDRKKDSASTSSSNTHHRHQRRSTVKVKNTIQKKTDAWNEDSEDDEGQQTAVDGVEYSHASGSATEKAVIRPPALYYHHPYQPRLQQHRHRKPSVASGTGLVVVNAAASAAPTPPPPVSAVANSTAGASTASSTATTAAGLMQPNNNNPSTQTPTPASYSLPRKQDQQQQQYAYAQMGSGNYHLYMKRSPTDRSLAGTPSPQHDAAEVTVGTAAGTAATPPPVVRGTVKLGYQPQPLPAGLEPPSASSMLVPPPMLPPPPIMLGTVAWEQQQLQLQRGSVHAMALPAQASSFSSLTDSFAVDYANAPTHDEPHQDANSRAQLHQQQEQQLRLDRQAQEDVDLVFQLAIPESSVSVLPGAPCIPDTEATPQKTPTHFRKRRPIRIPDAAMMDRTPVISNGRQVLHGSGSVIPEVSNSALDDADPSFAFAFSPRKYKRDHRVAGNHVEDDFPYVPSLRSQDGLHVFTAPEPPPKSVNVEELQLYQLMESGNVSHWKARVAEESRQLQNIICPPEFNDEGGNTGLSTAGPAGGSGTCAEIPSGDPRKGIQHKRTNLCLDTDAASSLQGAIEFSELKLVEVIGGGGFGQVWKAMWRGTPVAVKVLTGSAQSKTVPKPVLEEFAAEINLLRGMRHPNICLYMGASVDPPNRAIVTELAANGSLWDALRLPLMPPYLPCDGRTHDGWPLTLYQPDARHGAPPVTPLGGRSSSHNQSAPGIPPRYTWAWTLVQRVAVGAARGMAYLHSGKPPVLHRDLKSANILLDDSYVAKVCDFGLSRLKAQERSMTGNCGTVQWMAPEVLSNQAYNEKADVYSYGIICWELLTRECPYEGMTAIQCALAVLNRNHRPEIPRWCPPALHALIRSCVKKNPDERPSFEQILAHFESMAEALQQRHELLNSQQSL